MSRTVESTVDWKWKNGIAPRAIGSFPQCGEGSWFHFLTSSTGDRPVTCVQVANERILDKSIGSIIVLLCRLSYSSDLVLVAEIAPGEEEL